MSDVSRLGTHPTLGRLVWSDVDGWWETERRLPSGVSVDVRLDPGDEDREAFLARASALVPWAMANERRILAEAMRGELLDLYNGTWRQEGPPLTAEELTARLTLDVVIISYIEDVPIEFSYLAGDLFAGHIVAVEVGGDLRYRDVDLIG